MFCVSALLKWYLRDNNNFSYDWELFLYLGNVGTTVNDHSRKTPSICQENVYSPLKFLHFLFRIKHIKMKTAKYCGVGPLCNFLRIDFTMPTQAVQITSSLLSHGRRPRPRGRSTPSGGERKNHQGDQGESVLYNRWEGKHKHTAEEPHGWHATRYGRSKRASQEQGEKQRTDVAFPKRMCCSFLQEWQLSMHRAVQVLRRVSNFVQINEHLLPNKYMYG